MPEALPSPRASIDTLDAFCRAILTNVGCDAQTVDGATRAMIHASRLGVDSHGVRLLEHYVHEFEGGRVIKQPTVSVAHRMGAVGTINAGQAHGAVGAYAGVDLAVELAQSHGIGAVGVQYTAHFGAAGAYALAIAEAGMIGFVTCNSDNVVALHDGAEIFHGTNPLAMAVPVPGDNPWLMDLATSSVPYNKVKLARSTGDTLPEGVASTAEGEPTTDAQAAVMLKPLGGEFGYKGAALAGLAEILSAVANGMQLSSELLRFNGPDWETPRPLGHFVMAVRCDAFTDRATFDTGIAKYVANLRSSRPRAGATVMAPGDREWAEAKVRAANGVALDPATVASFAELAERYRVPPITLLAGSNTA